MSCVFKNTTTQQLSVLTARPFTPSLDTILVSSKQSSK